MRDQRDGANETHPDLRADEVSEAKKKSSKERQTRRTQAVKLSLAYMCDCATSWSRCRRGYWADPEQGGHLVVLMSLGVRLSIESAKTMSSDARTAWPRYS